MNKLPTIALVENLVANKDRYFEAALDNGLFRATHFLCFGGMKIYDTGIDSKELTWSPSEFIKFYNLAYWKIDYIV